MRYLVDAGQRSKFDEHARKGRYLGLGENSKLSVRIEGDRGKRLDVHGGMVVPDLSRAILPHSAALQEHAISAAVNSKLLKNGSVDAAVDAAAHARVDRLQRARVDHWHVRRVHQHVRPD